MKKVEIYKKDKWNMLHAEIQGRKIVVREISDQWGEETQTFLSRAEMMEWVEARYAPGRFDGDEDERRRIIESFKAL
jgi:hypothetical protein